MNFISFAATLYLVAHVKRCQTRKMLLRNEEKSFSYCFEKRNWKEFSLNRNVCNLVRKFTDMKNNGLFFWKWNMNKLKNLLRRRISMFLLNLILLEKFQKYLKRWNDLKALWDCINITRNFYSSVKHDRISRATKNLLISK